MLGLHALKAAFGLLVIVSLFRLECAAAKTLAIEVRDASGQKIQHAVISIPLVLSEASKKMAVMDQVAKQFSPHVLIVQKSQTVDFPNSDNIRHHVYSFSQPNQFEIRLFSGSEAEPVKFEHSGVVVLGCNVHDNMIGYIYVNDGELTVLTDKEGKANIVLPNDTAQEQMIEAQIWHPELSAKQSERMRVSLRLSTELQVVELPFVLEEAVPENETGFKSKW